jgi:hypothetical protein
MADDLDPEVRKIFVEIVLNSAAWHFQQCDVPLLCVYAEAIEQARSCARLIRAGNNTDAVLKSQANALRAISLCTMRLRCSPQARQPHRSRNSDDRPPRVTFYDKLAMEMDAGDDAVRD